MCQLVNSPKTHINIIRSLDQWKKDYTGLYLFSTYCARGSKDELFCGFAKDGFILCAFSRLMRTCNNDTGSL